MSEGAWLRALHKVASEQIQDRLDQLHRVWSLKDRGVQLGRSLALHLRKICLILGLEGHALPHLRKLIVCHNKLIVSNRILMKPSSCLSSMIRRFVANKCSSGTSTLERGKHLNALDRTKVLEELRDIFRGPLSREVLYVEVALLLRVFEAKLLLGELSLPLLGGKSGLNIDLLLIKFLSVKILDGLVGTLLAIVGIALLVIAHEGKRLLLSLLVLLGHHG